MEDYIRYVTGLVLELDKEWIELKHRSGKKKKKWRLGRKVTFNEFEPEPYNLVKMKVKFLENWEDHEIKEITVIGFNAPPSKWKIQQQRSQN